MPEIAFPWVGYVLIGLLSGTIGALFEVGGTIITTPFLNIIGLPMPFAIGTSAPVIATSATSSSIKNWLLGNIEYRSAFCLALCMIPSIEASSRFIRFFQVSHPGVIDPWLRAGFIIMVCITTTIWFLKKDRGPDPQPGFWEKLNLPPRIPVGASASISLWVLMGSGILAGFFAGLFGLGGGRVIMPVLIGVLGLGLKRSVGTSSFIILLSSIYSAATFSAKGLTSWNIAAFLIIGSIAGAWFGSATMHGIDNRLLRWLYLTLSLTAITTMSLRQAGATLSAAILLLASCTIIALTAYSSAWKNRPRP